MSSYLDRMNTVVEEARQEVKEAKTKNVAMKYKMSDKETEFAKSLYELMQISSFKKFLELESYEIGDLMTKAFDEPSASDFKDADFGRQMAFNKGKYTQMLRFRQRREELLKRYIYIIDHDNIKKGA